MRNDGRRADVRRTYVEYVSRMLDERVAEHRARTGEDLRHWRRSITDVMKLAGEDSSMESRRELAVDLGIENYEGTAEQNERMVAEFLQIL